MLNFGEIQSEAVLRILLVNFQACFDDEQVLLWTDRERYSKVKTFSNFTFHILIQRKLMKIIISSPEIHSIQKKGGIKYKHYLFINKQINKYKKSNMYNIPSPFQEQQQKQHPLFAHDRRDEVALKREQIHSMIRTRQINAMRRQYRMKYIEFKDPNDYELLKHINLQQTLQRFKNDPNDSQAIQDIFLYASSKEADHLFQLISESVVQGLVQVLLSHRETQQGRNEGEGCQWDRRVLWILTNYTAYIKCVHHGYTEKLLQLAAIIGYGLQANEQNGNIRVPFAFEAMENIILSILNMSINEKECRAMLEQHQELIKRVLTAFYAPPNSMSILLAKNYSAFSNILTFSCEFVMHLYSTIEFFEFPQSLQQNIITEIIRVLWGLLKIQAKNEEKRKLQRNMLKAVWHLLGNTLDYHPQVLLTIKQLIWELAHWFQRFLKTEKKATDSHIVINTYLSLLKIYFSPNIPESLENPIYELYHELFAEHVRPILMGFFVDQEEKLLLTFCLQVLECVALEGEMAEVILKRDAGLLQKIFQFCQDKDFGVRKASITCACNLIRTTIDSLEARDFCIAMIEHYRVSETISLSIWKNVDPQLNEALLQATLAILGQPQLSRGFFSQLQTAGAILRLQSLTTQTQNPDLVALAEQILCLYDQFSQQL